MVILEQKFSLNTLISFTLRMKNVQYIGIIAPFLGLSALGIS